MALYVRTGSYTGNSTDNRDISFSGTAFTPKWVVIKGSDATGSASGQVAVYVSGTGTISSYSADNSTTNSNMIQTVGSGTFQVGTDTSVNASGTTYNYFVMGGDDADIKVGTYTGNTSDNRSITGVGFQPTFVWTKGTANSNPCCRFKNNSGDSSFKTGMFGTTAINAIQAFETDGFQVGTSVEVNSNTATHYYVAIRDVSGQFYGSSYAGNGSDNRGITGIGFQPTVVFMTHDEATARNGVFRTASHVGDLTSIINNQTADIANVIQSLDADGFTVGTDTDANNSSYTYYYFAAKETSAASGPAKLKTHDTVTAAKIKTLDTSTIAKLKTVDTIV